MQGFESSHFEPNAELQKLQQEVESLRLKDLQQEHHISMLTEQLRMVQAEPSQEVTKSPTLQSSVSAKWQEWRHQRSRSPEPFLRPVNHEWHHSPGRQTKASQIQQAPGASSDRNQYPTQIPASMASSGKLGRSKGTFGSDHRWYQPTQAADRAAAFSRDLLAAAAVDQHHPDHASWLLKSASGSQFNTAQRSFGSELRWWEKGHHEKQVDMNQMSASQLAALAFAGGSNQHQHQQLEGTERSVRQSSPSKQYALLKQPSTFGTEPRFFQSPAAGHAAKPQLPAAALASDAPAAAMSSLGGIHAGTSPTPATNSLGMGPSQRSVSVDRGFRQSKLAGQQERAWWHPDPANAPDSTLQRIQQKHAHIQQLTAAISQRTTSARTHTAGSTFGSEPRWWENPVASRPMSASGHSDLQPGSVSSRTSPVRASTLQPAPAASTASLETTPHKPKLPPSKAGFGSEKRWWDSKEAHAAAAVRKAVSKQRSVSPDPMKDRARLSSTNAGASSSPADQTQAGMSTEQVDSKATEGMRAPSPPVGPNSVPPQDHNGFVHELSQRLHAQPWSQLAQVWPEPQSSAQAGGRPMPKGFRMSTGSVDIPDSPRSARSGSTSADSCVQRAREFTHCNSNSKLELTKRLRHRSAERQRLEQVRTPHSRDWAQGLRNPSAPAAYQRRNSNQEARLLQEDFLLKAREDLEAFQSHPTSPHRLSNASQPLSRASMEDAFTSVDAIQHPTGLQQPVHQLTGPHQLPVDLPQQAVGANQLAAGMAPQRPKTTLEARLERAARQRVRAAEQGPAWQTTNRRTSQQDKARKVAVHRQQQQLAAQQAQIRLAAFQQASERSHAETARRRHQEAAAAAAKAAATPAVRQIAPNVRLQPAALLSKQAASATAGGVPARLMPHSSLPSGYAASIIRHPSSGPKLFRSVSWAQQSQLQEPPHDDSFDLPHFSHTPKHFGNTPTHLDNAPVQHAMLQPQGDVTLPSQSAAPGLSEPVDAMDGAIEADVGVSASDDNGLLAEDYIRSRKEALDEYYKAKQAALQLVGPSSASTTAVEAVTAELRRPDADSASSPVEAATAVDAGVGQTTAVRRVSLVVPEGAQEGRVSANAFSPGRPGLKSQLSKMMEEVAQARSEVQDLSSQLSVPSRLGHRMESSVSYIADSEQELDTE